MRLFTLLSILCLLFSASAFARSEFTGKVLRVLDGDSLSVMAPGKQQVRVRLYGIDCPEKGQAFAERAREFTAQRLAGETVRVQILDTGRDGWTVGVVHAENGGNLNRELLTNGLAWVDPRLCKASFCAEWKEQELNARRAAVGLWVEKSPIPPWEFRKAGIRRR